MIVTQQVFFFKWNIKLDDIPPVLTKFIEITITDFAIKNNQL